jgi:phosphocarrier protein HPr
VNGLRTIPAVQFVKESRAFNADEISLTANGKSANAKSLYELETLGLVNGAVITISADGPKAQQAVDHLVAFIAQLQ